MLRPKSLDQGQDQLPCLRRRVKNDATKSGSQTSGRNFLTNSPPKSKESKIRDMASSDRFRRSSDRPASKAGTSGDSEPRIRKFTPQVMDFKLMVPFRSKELIIKNIIYYIILAM